MVRNKSPAKNGTLGWDNTPDTAKSVARRTRVRGDSAKNPFAVAPEASPDPDIHRYGNKTKRICRTEERGRATPRGRSLFEIVVDASEGFVPLWSVGSTLRFRFHSRSLKRFQRPDEARKALRELFGEALMVWGDASPVRFSEASSKVDFEIMIRNADDCDSRGCTLARAFFPGSGRNQLVLYPKLFEQSHDEQVETLVHELGHIFGLRHFFAPVSETDWASHIFGTHNRFSIMNYGADSTLTAADRSDLRDLYKRVWSGDLKLINGTPIKLFKPYSSY